MSKEWRAVTNNRIYISGRITGEPERECRRKFDLAVAKVEDFVFFDHYGVTVYLATGRIRYRAVNPWRLRLLGKRLGRWPWSVAMAVCLWNVARSSTVYMLRDWTRSRGARMENTLAQLLGKNVIYEEDEQRELFLG